MADYFDHDEYLKRIAVTTTIRADLDSLSELHTAQVTTLPFENLDIHLGRGINVDPKAIYTKTVQGFRGGYCFDLNGLFLNALNHFGFDARPLLARVHLSPEPGGRTHQVTRVSVDGQHWLADVGFGAASLRVPMPIELDRIDVQGGRHYRLVAADPWGTMLQIEHNGDWQNLYSFDDAHVCTGDIVTANHYTSTSPDVHFTKSRIVSLIRPDGRISMADMTLTEVTNGIETKIEIDDEAVYMASLRNRFGIELNADFKDFIAIDRSQT